MASEASWTWAINAAGEPVGWIARRYLGDERYTTKMIGETDDLADANGDTVLSFNQAQDKARAWASDLDKAERIAALGPVITVRGASTTISTSGPRRVTPSASSSTSSMTPSLAETPMAALTVADLQTRGALGSSAKDDRSLGASCRQRCPGLSQRRREAPPRQAPGRRCET